MRTEQYLTFLIAGAALVAPSIAIAQGGAGGRGTVTVLPTAHIVHVEPMENVPAIAGAPFTADATTEFTQMLFDGNRIERRFTTSLARDGRGRTRSEQDVAMLGPLGVLEKVVKQGGRGIATVSPAATEPPRFTVITDPVEGATVTLDERLKEARRSPFKRVLAHVVELKKLTTKLEAVRVATAPPGASEPVVESLGTRQIEGVSAEGTRSTTTIPAGQIGNLNPIQLVTERWFSKDLQTAVLITRRDPRSGDTVYRLTSIVRADPPPDLFTVPSDYRVVDLMKKVQPHVVFEHKLKKVEKARTGQE